MERLRDISRFWNWLPAFRAVGETSHLRSAAEALHLSPSALSRSIKQLEQSLGRDLFRRTNRRLELTSEGQQLLTVLRDAMRMVHEASVSIGDETLRGNLQIASEGVATSGWVLPATLQMREQHPELNLELSTDLSDVIQRLLSGQLDIVFLSKRISHERLRTVELGQASAGVYCSSIHPLHGKRNVTLEQVLGHDFVAPGPDEAGAPIDGWPQTLARKVALQLDSMLLGCEACFARPFLIVLPELVAENLGRGKLRRLPIDIIPAAPIYSTLRPSLGETSAAEVLMEVVSRQILKTGRS
ncbi:MAG: LysR family transcriptional regulator [Planctomycetota bacterium]|nr:LysR family transcriptional regulator [Planctomycetota bacterium]